MKFTILTIFKRTDQGPRVHSRVVCSLSFSIPSLTSHRDTRGRKARGPQGSRAEGGPRTETPPAGALGAQSGPQDDQPEVPPRQQLGWPQVQARCPCRCCLPLLCPSSPPQQPCSHQAWVLFFSVSTKAIYEVPSPQTWGFCAGLKEGLHFRNSQPTLPSWRRQPTRLR